MSGHNPKVKENINRRLQVSQDYKMSGSRLHFFFARHLILKRQSLRIALIPELHMAIHNRKRSGNNGHVYHSGIGRPALRGYNPSGRTWPIMSVSYLCFVEIGHVLKD